MRSTTLIRLKPKTQIGLKFNSPFDGFTLFTNSKEGDVLEIYMTQKQLEHLYAIINAQLRMAPIASS